MRSPVPESSRRRAASLLAMPMLGLVMSTWGCRHVPEPITDRDPVILEDVDLESTWRRFQTAQSDRLDGLSRWTSAGTATLRFVDGDGERRVEQVDLRLWRETPARAAIRLSKVGNAFILAGWNGPRWWFLDETGDEAVLRIHEQGGAAGVGAEGLLSPPVLLVMLGLFPFPEAMPDSLVPLAVDDQGLVESVGFGLEAIDWSSGADAGFAVPGRVVVEVGRDAAGPRQVRWFDEQGRVLLEANLDRAESVETRGRAPGAWPRLPHRIVVSRPDEDQVVVTLDRPLAGGEISSRLFDLEALRRRHPDAIVESMVGGGS